MPEIQSFKIAVISNCNLNLNKIDRAFVPHLASDRLKEKETKEQNLFKITGYESAFHFYDQIYF